MQVPKLPVAGNKRKLPDNPSPELLKKLKMEGSFGSESISRKSSANAESRNGTYKATVEDADEDEAPFAPGGDADYFAEEDGEGRFYGGGLTSEQKDILNIFDKAEGEPDEDDVSISLSCKLVYLLTCN
jgi:beta-catenin-like protein 1